MPSKMCAHATNYVLASEIVICSHIITTTKTATILGILETTVGAMIFTSKRHI